MYPWKDRFVADMGKRILINGTNLHGGGASQVATSLVNELSRSDRAGEITLVLSTFVREECERTGADLAVFRRVVQKDVFGFRWADAEMSELFDEADVVFTVFGPLYFRHRPKTSIVGFAQPWIIYPDTDAARTLSWTERIKTRVRYLLQKRAFARNSDVLIVEANHVEKRLRSVLPTKRVHIVPNALNAVFDDAIRALPDELPERARVGARVPESGRITLGFVGRAYPHKNLTVFPAVRRELKVRYGLEATIKTTLAEKEWAMQSERFKAEVQNVGSLSLQQCVDFYRTLDGVLFPSLLECFSATPLEAMAMGLPLYASDRHFVRDSCAEYPFYFDPHDPASIAVAIHESLALESKTLLGRLRAGREHVFSLPSAADRARRTAEIIFSV